MYCVMSLPVTGYKILILGTLKQNMLEIFIKTCKVISKNEKKYV